MGLRKIMMPVLHSFYVRKTAINDKKHQGKIKKYIPNQSVSVLLAIFMAFFTLPTSAAEVEKVQVGTVTLSATSQKITIKPVIDNKSLLIFNLLADRTTAGPQDTHLRGQLRCTDGRCDEIDFKRYGSNGRVSVRWQVIEFKSSSLVKIQRGIETQLSMANSPPQKIIKTRVDRRKSFVLLSEFVNGGVSGADAFTRGQINRVGDLVLTAGSKKRSASQSEIAWQVVEYQQAVVQTGDVRFGRTDESKTVSMNVVDTSKSWLIYNYYTTGNGAVSVNPVCQNLVSGTIANTNTLQFNRGCANKNGVLNLSWFVIEFTDDTLVQQSILSFRANQRQQTIQLEQEVDVNCALTHLGYHQRGGQSSATADHTASAWFNANLNKAGTELTLLRGQTNNAVAESGWSVLTFAGCGTDVEPKDYGDAPLSGVAPDGVSSNGYGVASHKLVRGVYLGFANPDADDAYQDSLNAGGDDRNGLDDEDILSISDLIQGGTASFTIFVSGKKGYLQAWIDFDGNGKFDVKEQIATNLQDNGMGDDAVANDGTIVFKVAIPTNAITKQTYARFRWSTTRSLDAVTTAKDGEVEDYAVIISASVATLAKMQDMQNIHSRSQSNKPKPVDLDIRIVPISEETTKKNKANERDTSDQSIAEVDTPIVSKPEPEAIPEPNGIVITGRVYKDSNVNGKQDAKETGVSGLPVVLLDVNNKTCVSARTDADGYYTFSAVVTGRYQLYEASREKVPVPRRCGVVYAKDPIAYRSTTDNVLAPFDVVDTDTDMVGKDFGDVKIPVFNPNHNDKVSAGHVMFYKHTLMPRSLGKVSFSTTNNTPTSAGWSSVIYHDVDCDGDLAPSEAKTALSDSLTTQANKAICLINKVYVPSGVADDEKYTNVITARFDFDHPIAGVIKRRVTDQSKVVVNDVDPIQGEQRLELKKTVENLTQGSAETDTQQQVTTGDILQYRIYYSNTGAGVISELVINDIIPDFGTLNAVPACEKPLPAGLTKCMPLVDGRDIQWEFPVTDLLQKGQHGVVSYQVKVGE